MNVVSSQVKVIFEEFYEQGDAEREAGRIPIPMMDRTKLHLQPDSQVEFITGICIPCYSLLNRLIPETQPLLDGCQSNLERWKELAVENASILTPPPAPSTLSSSSQMRREIRESRVGLSRTGSLPIKIDFDVLNFDWILSESTSERDLEAITLKIVIEPVTCGSITMIPIPFEWREVWLFNEENIAKMPDGEFDHLQICLGLPPPPRCNIYVLLFHFPLQRLPYFIAVNAVCLFMNS